MNGVKILFLLFILLSSVIGKKNPIPNPSQKEKDPIPNPPQRSGRRDIAKFWVKIFCRGGKKVQGFGRKIPTPTLPKGAGDETLPIFWVNVFECSFLGTFVIAKVTATHAVQGVSGMCKLVTSTWHLPKGAQRLNRYYCFGFFFKTVCIRPKKL